MNLLLLLLLFFFFVSSIVGFAMDVLSGNCFMLVSLFFPAGVLEYNSPYNMSLTNFCVVFSLQGCDFGMCTSMAKKSTSSTCKWNNVPGIFFSCPEFFISGKK